MRTFGKLFSGFFLLTSVLSCGGGGSSGSGSQSQASGSGSSNSSTSTSGNSDDEPLVNAKVIDGYIQGANVYIEGQLSTRKWKDESTGQDKYSTEVILQGYNSNLTMLDGRNKSENTNLVSENKSTLPDENLNQDKNDLDDEIPF